MDRFVFTTRYLGEGCCFKDSEMNCLPADGEVYKFIINHIANEEAPVLVKDLWDIVKDNNSINIFFENKDWKKLPLQDFGLFKNTLQTNRVSYRDHLLEWLQQQTDPQCMALRRYFSFYTLPRDNKGMKENDVFAVHHLAWTPKDEKWIIAIAKESAFGNTLQKDDHLYMVLHDKDLPNKTEPFLVLNESECNILKQKTGLACELHIILFQHTSNDIVMILKNSKIGAEEIRSKIRRLVEYRKKIVDLFSAQTLEADKASIMKVLPTDIGLDMIKNSIDTSFISQKCENLYYVYEDKNNALLIELMHTLIGIDCANQFKALVRKLREEAYNKEIPPRITEIKKMKFPLIVKIYRSIFKDWENLLDKDEDKKAIRNHHNKKAMENNLKRVFSFFNNSSIWVRLVDMYDENAFKAAVAEFKYFDRIGLYDYASAWENLEYNTRSFADNYLFSTLDGHGSHVTPKLYGNEVEAKEILQGNKALKK